MITNAQAMTANVFHLEPTPWGTGRPCDGKKGPERWRRNGRTLTWKRDPSRIEVPVKFGLRSYSRLTADVFRYVHTAEDCPAGHTY